MDVLIVSRRRLGHLWTWRREIDGEIVEQAADGWALRDEALKATMEAHVDEDPRPKLHVSLDDDPKAEPFPAVKRRPAPVVQTPEDVVEPDQEEEDAPAPA